LQLKQPLNLSAEFLAILDQLETSDESMFITGRAGTGKSTLLQLFRNTTRKRTAVLAPTGIAALNSNRHCSTERKRSNHTQFLRLSTQDA